MPPGYFNDDDDRGWSDVDGTICLSHVADPSLQTAVEPASEYACSICGRTQQPEEPPFAVPLNDVLTPFMEAFWREYTRMDQAPYFDGSFVLTTDTAWAVSELASVAFKPTHSDRLSDLFSAAIDDPEVGTLDAPVGTDEISFAWSRFEETVKHESRFVFAGSTGPGREVIEFLGRLGQLASDHSGLIKHMPTHSAFVRARTLPHDLDWYHDADPGRRLPADARALGPAPASQASANRMSPAGIPMFYGAEDEETALTEVAAYTTDNHAVVATFHPSRPLRMLSLHAKALLPSPFDETQLELRVLLMFLDEFQQVVSRPIRPDGRQHVEYVPTQIVAEFFRRAATPKVDGIVFPSSHTGRSNYVVFATADDIEDQSGEEVRKRAHPGMDPQGPETPKLLRLDPTSIRLRRLRHRVDTSDAGTFTGRTWLMNPGNDDW